MSVGRACPLEDAGDLSARRRRRRDGPDADGLRHRDTEERCALAVETALGTWGVSARTLVEEDLDLVIAREDERRLGGILIPLARRCRHPQLDRQVLEPDREPRRRLGEKRLELSRAGSLEREQGREDPTAELGELDEGKEASDRSKGSGGVNGLEEAAIELDVRRVTRQLGVDVCAGKFMLQTIQAGAKGAQRSSM